MENKLGVIEGKFADIIWNNAPITTAQLVKQCAEEFDWKRTTTYTVLKRLSNRGIFQTQNGTVTPLVSREEFYAKRSTEFVEESFQGSLPAFLAAFTSRRKLSAKEIEEIQEMIDAYGETK